MFVYSPHRNISEVNNLKVVKSPDELAYERGEGIYARCSWSPSMDWVMQCGFPSFSRF